MCVWSSRFFSCWLLLEVSINQSECFFFCRDGMLHCWSAIFLNWYSDSFNHFPNSPTFWSVYCRNSFTRCSNCSLSFCTVFRCWRKLSASCCFAAISCCFCSISRCLASISFCLSDLICSISAFSYSCVRVLLDSCDSSSDTRCDFVCPYCKTVLNIALIVSKSWNALLAA